MDIQRTPRRRPPRVLIGAAVLLLLVAATVGINRLEAAAPTVERQTVWIDSVRRGRMVREVRAPGTLVPERVRMIPALTAGRVEALPVRPGTMVGAGTELVQLVNPDVQLEALEAERQLAGAEATALALGTTLREQLLSQRAAIAQLEAQASDAARQRQVLESLGAQRHASLNEVSAARERATELDTRLRLERERLRLLDESIDRQLALQRSQLERLRGVAAFHRQRVASMRVTAGDSGMLQEMNLELGQWVLPGQLLAKVAQPGRLKAVLRVPETQARDVAVGQSARIDTRNGVVAGRVMRVDPAVQGGSVEVEVALEGALPRGARPDLSVDGTIELERIPDVLHVGRPAYGQPESTIGLFRLEADGVHATRVPVVLGRASVTTIEVRSGLAPGDRVIISDVSQYDGHDRIRLR